MSPHNHQNGGLRCAVLLGIDFDGTSHEVGRGVAPLGGQSWGRYSAKCGVPRHLDLLDETGVRATFYVPGYDAERHPDLVREIADRGHEVAAHGYLHEAWDLDSSEEAELLHRTDDILASILDERVVGWRSPSGRKTLETLSILHSLGYIYDSSEKDFDRPYMINLSDNGDKTILELPNNTYSLDDFPFYKFSFTPPSEVLEQWKDEFVANYHDNGIFVLTVHPRSGWGSGTPARTHVLRELIRYIKRHKGVRFFTAREYAEYYAAHAYSGEVGGQES